jgi:hypothetical protein
LEVFLELGYRGGGGGQERQQQQQPEHGGRKVAKTRWQQIPGARGCGQSTQWLAISAEVVKGSLVPN